MLISDEAILKAIVHRDESVLHEFMVYHFQWLLSFIVKNGGTREDAEDVMQDAMMLIYQMARKDKLILEKGVTDYFYGISKNYWYQKAKKKKYFDRNTNTEEMELDEDIQDDKVIDEINTLERYALYEKYLAELSGVCKEILTLLGNGLSFSEIAEKKNWSRRYAYRKKATCKEKLIKKIKQDPRYSELKFDE